MAASRKLMKGGGVTGKLYKVLSGQHEKDWTKNLGSMAAMIVVIFAAVLCGTNAYADTGTFDPICTVVGIFQRDYIGTIVEYVPILAAVGIGIFYGLGSHSKDDHGNGVIKIAAGIFGATVWWVICQAVASHLSGICGGAASF